MSDNVARQKQFKNTGKHEEMRRRRAEGSLELRKQRKEEQMMKRRNVGVDDLHSEDEQAAAANGNQSVPAVDTKLMNLADCLNALKEGKDRDRCFMAVESIRRHLSRQRTPPIEDVIKIGIVPYLIKALHDSSFPKFQFEAAWALTNITSGSTQQTMAVVNEGAIEPLVRLLGSTDVQVAEQCAWALGNITGESALLRDVVIEAGIVDRLIYFVKRPDISVDCMRTIAWTMSNLCRYKNPQVVAFEVVEKLAPSLAVLIHHPDSTVVCDACWAFAYISDGNEQRIDLIIRMGVLDRLIALASGSDMSLIPPALRCLGNVVTGDDAQTQAVLDKGILQNVLPTVFATNKNSLTREGCWLVSNICAGNTMQIQTVIISGILPTVIKLLGRGEFRTQLEAAWTVYNICSGGTTEQATYILQQGALPNICNLFKSKETRAIVLTLDAVGLMLDIAQKVGELEQATLVVEECGGLDEIEQLQNHENEDIYHKALQLVEKYFSEGDVGDENGGSGDSAIQFQNPGIAPDGGFNF